MRVEREGWRWAWWGWESGLQRGLGGCSGAFDGGRRRQGALAPIVDSVYAAGEEAAFLRRTYTDPERFGKVVYRWEADSAKATT